MGSTASASRVKRGNRLFVELARRADDLLEAQALRYKVFGEEMGANLKGKESGLDVDELDPGVGGQRLPRLIQTLHIAKGDGSYPKLLKQLARFDVLVIDDWGITAVDENTQRDLLEILDDRFNMRSTIVTSQLPLSNWHEYLGQSTLADAILDRLVHNAYKIELRGESMRKTRNALTEPTT